MSTTSTTTYDIKPPAAVLAEDVICQSFIQSSSTLAYACLLIRSGKHGLAAHVLHSLEAKPASRFKDMVFYLQAQIGIETGDYAAVKKRLVPRVHQHPNDMVALSLLEACIFREWEAWRGDHPAEAALSAALAEAHAQAPAPQSHEPAHHEPSPTGPAPAPRATDTPRSLEAPVTPVFLGGDPRHEARHSGPPAFPTVPIRQLEPAEAPRAQEAPAFAPSNDRDFGVYQGLAGDAQTLALGLWNNVTRKFRSVAKREDLKALVGLLPQALPHPLAAAVRALDGGEIFKVCYCFRDLTVTTLHSEVENLGLLTGNLNQSLLTLVRADNIFQKQSPLSASARGSGPIGRESLEVNP